MNKVKKYFRENKNILCNVPITVALITINIILLGSVLIILWEACFVPKGFAKIPHYSLMAIATFFTCVLCLGRETEQEPKKYWITSLQKTARVLSLMVITAVTWFVVLIFV